MSEVRKLNELFENTKKAYLKGKKATDEKLKQAAIKAGFDALADYLMNKCVLDVNGNEYRIVEIEFYYFDENKKDKHTDVFTHCNPKQKEHNKFYFHGSGIDITFGNNNYYGGILLRGLINCSNKAFILGPHKVSTEILHNANKIDNEIDNKLELTITLKEKQQHKMNIVKSCRVGLYINNSNNCKDLINSEEIEKLKKDYIFRPYRYILNDDKLLYELLKNSSNEPTFLAWFLRNENFEMSELNKRIHDDLLKNLKEKKKSFFDIKDSKKKEIRNLFIEENIEKKTKKS